MEDERVYLTADEAIRMLPDGDMIHTYRQGGGFVLIGADWERERLVEKIASGKPEFAGENATRSGHGLAIVDEHGPLYIETKRQTEEQRLTAELAALRADLEQALVVAARVTRLAAVGFAFVAGVALPRVHDEIRFGVNQAKNAELAGKE